MYRTASLPIFIEKLISPADPSFGVSTHSTRAVPPIVALGLIGSGKSKVSQALLHEVLRSLPSRPTERVVLWDYTRVNWGATEDQKTRHWNTFSQLPIPDEATLLLSGCDSRAVVWDIGKDLETSEQRTAFVDAFVEATPPPPGTKDQWLSFGKSLMWECLAAIDPARMDGIHSWKFFNARESGGPLWTWHTLRDTLHTMTKETHRGPVSHDILTRLYHTMDTLVRGQEGKNRITFSISDWFDTPRVDELPGSSWSQTRTLNNRSVLTIAEGPRQERTHLILPTLFLALLATKPTSCAPTKTWVFHDEAAACPLPPSLFRLVPTGYKRGLQWVMGFQCLSQLSELYGAGVGDAFLREVYAAIVCRSITPDTVEVLGRQWGIPFRELAELGPRKDGVTSLGVISGPGQPPVQRYVWPYAEETLRRAVSWQDRAI